MGGQTRFEDNPACESVSRDKGVKTPDVSHQELAGPQNTIEEFDPGSA